MEKKQQTKYKPGNKFVVEVAEVYQRTPKRDNERPDTLYRMRHFSSLVFDEAGLDKLERYKEKDFSSDEVEEIVNTAMRCFDDLTEMVKAKAKENIYAQDWRDWDDVDVDDLIDTVWMTKVVHDVRKKFMMQFGIEDAYESCEEDEEE